MPIVIDAFITASWHFEQERNERSDAILDFLNEDSARVPAIWWFEIRNVILLGERGRRATPEQTSAFLARLARLPIGVAAIPDEARLMDLCRRHRLTFYDAAYLELAQREAIPLATLDKELVAAARAEGVSLILAAP